MEAVASLTVTAATEADLVRIARTLVGEGLIGCANIIPAIRSIYTWQDEVHDEPEALAILHTRADLTGTVIDRISEIHPYDTPQVVALPITAVQADYADWLVTATR